MAEVVFLGIMHQNIPKLSTFVLISDYFSFQEAPQILKFYFTTSLDTKIDEIFQFFLIVPLRNMYINFIKIQMYFVQVVLTSILVVST